MAKAIFPGSFDPITNGHVEVVETAAKMFEKVYVVIMTNTSKEYLFDEKERLNLAKKVFEDTSNVEVIARPAELTVEVAHELDATAIVRGLRNTVDFNYERDIAAINKTLDPNLNTVLLFTRPEDSFISSSMIKETVFFGGDVSSLVPTTVAVALEEKLSNKNEEKKKIKLWLLSILAALAVVVFCLLPTNYYIEAPGEAFQISRYIKSSRKANPNFYLVTVSERPAVMIDYLTSFLRPSDTRYSKQELMGTSTNAEYNQMQQYYMETSQNNAIYYAAKKADVPHRQEFLGVYVMEIMKNSTFKNKLKVGDILVAVNNHKFKSSNDLVKYVSSLKSRNVKIEVIRKNKHLTFSGKTVKLENTNRYGIGIQLVDHTRVVTDPTIKIKANDIGGPSAGLMFTLECYQLFTKKNLSPKEKIAGTGTIDSTGKVGMIGGVDKKVIAASRQNMKVFFAPTDRPAGVKKSETNYQEAVRTAKKIHTKMKIVPVARFEDALNYLEK